MADEATPATWRLIMFAGLGDVVFGVGMAFAGLTGLLGDEGMIFAIVGGLLVLGGAAIAVWARKKLSKAVDRRGDLN